MVRDTKNILITLILCCCFVELYSQVNVRDSAVFAPQLRVSYSYQLPSKDLAKRFGNNSNLGASFLIKTKSNWLFGFDGTYLFGEILKEDSILKSISTKEGDIITENGQLAIVRLYERGYTTQIKGGKLFPVLSPNKNSGFYFTLGLGFIQHKIKIDNVGNSAPQLSDEYKKGYDRLSYGLAVSEFVGYSFLSNNRLVNFYAGVEFYQSWTKGRRTFNYDTMQQNNLSRKDNILGFRAGWIIPLYKKLPNEYYYN